MVLNICKVWFNGIKIAFFPKNYKKSPNSWGLRPQTPVCDTFELHWLSQNVSKVTYLHFSTILVETLSLCKILVKWKAGKFLMTSLHVICGLGLPIKNSGYAFKLEIAWKTFLKTFFFREQLRLCPWSLAPSIPVLGLERVCPRKGCPWPRIFFVSLALASSLVSSTPPLRVSKINYLSCGLQNNF